MKEIIFAYFILLAAIVFFSFVQSSGISFTTKLKRPALCIADGVTLGGFLFLIYALSVWTINEQVFIRVVTNG